MTRAFTIAALISINASGIAIADPVVLNLGSHKFLLGDHFTVADAYLFTVTSWADHVKVDLSPFPKLQAFQKAVSARPAVQDALRAEGLIH